MVMLSLAAVLWLSGCHPSDQKIDTGLTGPVAAAIPPGVPASSIQLRSIGESAKANMTLAEVLAQWPLPAYLHAKAPAASQPATRPQSAVNQPATRPSTQPDDLYEPELPLAVQKAYIAARQALHGNNVLEAVHQLNEALIAAPDQPEILRLLGEIHFSLLNNKDRGLVYLEQSVAASPTDVESLFVLGRAKIEKGDLDAAIILLAKVVQSPDKPIDPGLLPVAMHLLGSALERQGYDLASATQYETYLPASSLLTRTSRFVRELILLDRQRSRTWVSAGDERNRLGQFDEALADYQRAQAAMDAGDQLDLTPRLVYADLRAGHSAEACLAVLAQLRQTPGNASGLPMVQYLLDQGVRPAALAKPMREIYDNAKRPPSLGLVVAWLLPAGESRDFLWTHLQQDPTALDIFQAILQQDFEAGDSTAVTAQVLRDMSRAMDAQPAKSRLYVTALQRTLPAGRDLLGAFASLKPQERTTFAARYLHALALIWAQKPKEALPELRDLVEKSTPPLPAAWQSPRVELAQLLLDQNEVDEAGKVLDSLPDAGDPQVLTLRVRMLAGTKRLPEALKILDQQMTGPRRLDVDLVLLKVNVLLRWPPSNRQAEAEQLLWEAIDAHPEAELLYANLAQIFDAAVGSEGDRQRLNLLRRALQNIPNARLTRLLLAQDQIRGNNPYEAQQTLAAVLAEQPNDWPALELMLLAMQRDNREADARKMLADRLQVADPPSPLLVVAQRFYGLIDDQKGFFEVTERLLLRLPAGQERTLKLASLYLQTDRATQAVDTLLPLATDKLDQPVEYFGLLGRAMQRAGQPDRADTAYSQALTRWPQMAPELRFEWAMLWEMRGRKDRSQAMLNEVLHERPDHAGANNAVGYAWVEQGQHMDEARQMILKALKADPNNAAYLDSLGWYHYQMGRYDTAVEWLTKARQQPGGDHPEILAHLGDAMWRSGRRIEGLQYWRAAQRGITPAMQKEEQEVRDLVGPLEQRIDAAMHDWEPVFPKPVNNGQVPATKPAAPATAPAGVH